MFAALAAFQSIWIFQGLDGVDLADAGMYLTFQVQSFPRPPRAEDTYIYEFARFLTDYVGGMWLALPGEPGLLWARIGGVLVQSLTGLVCYILLSAHFESKKVFRVVLVCALFITSLTHCLAIHHYTFPALLVGLALLAFDRLLTSRAGTLRSKSLALLLGFLLVSVALARLPLFTCAVVMLPILSASGAAGPSNKMERRTKALWTIAGMLISAALYGLLYQWLRVLNPYVVSVYELVAGSIRADAEVTDHHQMSGLLQSYLAGYGKYLAAGLVGGGVLLGLWRVRTWVGQRAMTAGLALVAVGGYVLLAQHHGIRIATSKVMCGLGVAVVFAGVLYFLLMRGRGKAFGPLLLASVLSMLLGPLGSGSGLSMMYYGMWVALPLAFLVMDLVKKEVGSRRIAWVCSLKDLALWLMVPLGIVAHYNNLLGDRKNRLEHDTEFTHCALRHIHSYPTRVAQVDAALTKIGELAGKGDSILIVGGGLSLFHFLTQTKPFLGNPQPGLETLPVLRRRIHTALENNQFPKVVVLLKGASSPSGGTIVPGRAAMSPKFEYLRAHYIDKIGYRLVWENSLCEMYAPSPEPWTSGR